MYFFQIATKFVYLSEIIQYDTFCIDINQPVIKYHLHNIVYKLVHYHMAIDLNN